jgi:hypothetical protein
MVASTSGSLSTGTTGTLLLPLKREDTLSMAELSWLIFAFKVCLVLFYKLKQKKIFYLKKKKKKKGIQLAGSIANSH